MGRRPGGALRACALLVALGLFAVFGTLRVEDAPRAFAQATEPTLAFIAKPSDGNAGVYVADHETRTIWRIVPDDVTAGLALAWHPGGTGLAFVRIEGDTSSLDLITLDGSASASIFQSTGRITGLEWSPDGSAIAFTERKGPGGRGDESLSITSADGSARELFEKVPSSNCLAWSPDGTQLATIAFDTSPPSGSIAAETAGVYLVRPGSTEAPRLLSDITQSAVRACPVWSPDGKLAYLGFDYYAGGDQLYVYAANDPSASPIALPSLGSIPCAVWSPDGTQLAARFGARVEMVLIDASSGNTRPFVSSTFTPIARIGNACPDWSRDGKFIAFIGVKPDTQVVRVAGLSDTAARDIPLPQGEGAFRVTWSPNSQWLAYATLSAPSNFRAYIHQLDGNEPWNLSEIVQPQSFPLWRPMNDPPVAVAPFPLGTQPGQSGVSELPVRVNMPGIPWALIGIILFLIIGLVIGGSLWGRYITRIRITKPVSGTTVLSATEESVIGKLDKYLLNLAHPEGGSKAKWFQQALGFTRENMNLLANQIIFNEAKSVATQLTIYGQKYNQVISITGANGRVIDVMFAWIKNNDGIVRLITAIPL